MARAIPLVLLAAFALPATAQDWSADLDKACKSPKLGIRLAAARKLATGGDAAMAAIGDYERVHGRNTLPQTLVEAIGTLPEKSDATLGLLLSWARDRDFYWRAQALAGLAAAGNPRREQHRAHFVAALTDPAHLFRIAGAKGLLGLGSTADRERVVALLDDPDPRVRCVVAVQLLDSGERRAAPLLVEALRGCDREFLGDPWGKRDANLAIAALERHFGTREGFDLEKSAGQNADAIAALADRAKKLVGNTPASRRMRLDLPRAEDLPRSGLEIRSCKHGDLFVRIGNDGNLWFGLEGERRERLPPEAWNELADVRKRIAGEAAKTFGVVICDFVRWRSVEQDQHWKCAPGALPPPLVELLKTLADRLESTKQTDLSQQVRARLRQMMPE